jgi:hypothetical protein
MMMRPGRKQNSILNSPFVRALINPVKTVIPSSTLSPSSSSPSTTTGPPRVPEGANPYLSIIAQERGEELPPPLPEHLIPTQPQTRIEQPQTATTSDVEGKKRARSEDEVVEWDEKAGMRYGVVTKYSEENLPQELEKCE